MEAKLGQIMCSGPSHAAVDNFAHRLDQSTRAVASRYNRTKAPNDLNRCHGRLVIRVYKPRDEFTALKRLLKDPKAIETAANKGEFAADSHWKLHLSWAYWLLVILRSDAVPPLDSDASPVLHSFQQFIDSNPGLLTLRQVATGQITWEDYIASTTDAKEKIERLMLSLMNKADFLCALPSNAELEPICIWKTERAKGLAVDEAANMNRADLYGLWGNTLLPCFLFGDPRQLPPTVITTWEKDAADNLLNRFAADGAVSPLAFLQASGIPVFRLKTQLRMAQGMFDLVAKAVYHDVPFGYGLRCRIDLPEHKPGRDIESFFLAKFPDELTPSPAGRLLPIFVHCEGGRVSTDPRTGSKRSPDQVKIALDLLVELLNATQISTSSIACISPYKANVGLINSMMKKNQALHDIRGASTVDSFHGQENDVILLIMGTAHPNPGPGFTASAKRLNIMLTRQKSALIIVGDINITQGNKEQYYVRDEATGALCYVTGRTINTVYGGMKEAGRVVKVLKEAPATEEPTK
ncbi:hypothetical protein IL306_007409 [Fusarium sp. DS 682]|nr:hypothetical protein IL306_007409 [Fusarium sp. DS 682]